MIGQSFNIFRTIFQYIIISFLSRLGNQFLYLLVLIAVSKFQQFAVKIRSTWHFSTSLLKSLLLIESCTESSSTSTNSNDVFCVMKPDNAVPTIPSKAIYPVCSFPCLLIIGADTSFIYKIQLLAYLYGRYQYSITFYRYGFKQCYKLIQLTGINR
jgi:hypothetical protein